MRGCQRARIKADGGLAVRDGPCLVQAVGRREVQDRALAHDLERVQSAVMDLYTEAFQTSAATEATAMQPLD